MKKRGRKPVEKEEEKPTQKMSLVDQVLSRQYWKKKRRVELRRKRLLKKKLEAEKKKAEAATEKSSKNVSEELIDFPKVARTDQHRDREERYVNTSSGDEEVAPHVTLDSVLSEKIEVDEKKDDLLWQVKDGLFEEGDIIDIERRTSVLIDDKNVPNDEYDSDDNIEYIVDEYKLRKVEGDLNEMFGIPPEPEEMEENTLSLNGSFGDSMSGSDRGSETSEKSEESKKKEEEEGKFKSVVDMILSPGYFRGRKKRRKGKKKGRGRGRKVNPRRKK